jgi:hypothetical protein
MDEENSAKTDAKSTKKQMFVKGGAPGPGRKKVKDRPPVSLQEMESLVQGDLRSKDPKIRHAATKLLIILKAKMEEQKKDLPVLTSEAWAFYSAKVDDLTIEDAEYHEVDGNEDDS